MGIDGYAGFSLGTTSELDIGFCAVAVAATVIRTWAINTTNAFLKPESSTVLLLAGRGAKSDRQPMIFQGIVQRFTSPTTASQFRYTRRSSHTSTFLHQFCTQRNRKINLPVAGVRSSAAPALADPSFKRRNSYLNLSSLIRNASHVISIIIIAVSSGL
jgi:hypothetical protein